MNAANYNIEIMPPSLQPFSPTKPLERQVAVLMSGGVDSSTTAHLLLEDGWDVLGITMKVPVSCDNGPRTCCGADAAFVCNELGIAHHFIDVTEAFEKLIIEPFRRAYATGRTPNPCADCNTFLKFSLVWDVVRQHFGVEYLATGHYAKIVKTGDKTHLARAADKSKDQSYFLYGIAAGTLDKLILPLGDYTKQQIRTIAAELKLTVADKPESMELCFAGQGDYRRALADDGADRPGDITDMDGNTIGTHKGIANYTIGQRRGLGFAAGQPVYVGRIDPKKNTVALGTKQQVSSAVISADQINILIPEQLKNEKELFAKIRSGGDPARCKLTALSADTFTVEFDQPLFAPCPGQKIVLYDPNENLIAGGTIIH